MEGWKSQNWNIRKVVSKRLAMWLWERERNQNNLIFALSLWGEIFTMVFTEIRKKSKEQIWRNRKKFGPYYVWDASSLNGNVKGPVGSIRILGTVSTWVIFLKMVFLNHANGWDCLENVDRPLDRTLGNFKVWVWEKEGLSKTEKCNQWVRIKNKRTWKTCKSFNAL